MKRVVALLLLLAAQSACHASVLHWTTRLMGMNCDNRPLRSVAKDGPRLALREKESDLLTPTRFTAARPLNPDGRFTLAACNGEVHIEPSDSPTLKIDVQLLGPLPHERTPKDYLQQFDAAPGEITILWKLPASAKPVIHVYLPSKAHLNLQLGRSELVVQGIEGEKLINLGRGSARLYVQNGNTDFSHIDVDVAMGSFTDLRPGGRQNHKVPLHEEFAGTGMAKSSLSVAMGKAEIASQ